MSVIITSSSVLRFTLFVCRFVCSINSHDISALTDAGCQFEEKLAAWCFSLTTQLLYQSLEKTFLTVNKAEKAFTSVWCLKHENRTPYSKETGGEKKKQLIAASLIFKTQPAMIFFLNSVKTSGFIHYAITTLIHFRSHSYGNKAEIISRYVLLWQSACPLKGFLRLRYVVGSFRLNKYFIQR